MTAEKLEQIFNDLTRAHARKRDNALIKAKAEIACGWQEAAQILEIYLQGEAR